MKKTDYLIMLGIAAAAGAVAGMLADRKYPAKGGLLGASAGVIAGSVAAGIYQHMDVNRVPYYSSASSLYDESDLI